MQTRLSAKKLIQKIYLTISAFVVFYGTMPVLFIDGAFNAGGLRFYTVLSNLFVAFGFFIMALLPKWRGRSYLSFAALVCICVTGVVYNALLVPFGGGAAILSDWTNFSLHFFSMLLVLVNYFVFEEKGSFTYKHLCAGLIPSLLYWAVFVFIGGSPYFFMNPESIGWLMILFWLAVIMIFIVGLTLAIILFDKGRRLHAGGLLLTAGLLCALLVFFFVERPATLITSFAFSVENVLELEEGDDLPVRSDFSVEGEVLEIEEGVSLVFELDIRRAGSYTFEFGAVLSTGIITAFLITDENGEVVFHYVGEDFASAANVEFNAGIAVVSWSYLATYEDLSAFLARMGLGSVEQEQGDYFRTVFNRNTVDAAASGQLFLRRL
jgi:hypothetical protein